MAVYQFRTEQLLPAPIEEVWDFISSPDNLKKITPESMGFEIISEGIPEKMYAGMMITYMVKPLFGIKTKWVTEITHIEQGKFFIDEQRVGPYSLWHHQHFVEKVENGVLMKDIVTYSPPFSFIGALVNSILIKKKLKEIFDYRRVALERHFNLAEQQ